MRTDDLKVLFKNAAFRPEDIKTYIINLLNKFEVALLWDDHNLLIPSLLPSETDLRERRVKSQGVKVSWTSLGDPVLGQGLKFCFVFFFVVSFKCVCWLFCSVVVFSVVFKLLFFIAKSMFPVSRFLLGIPWFRLVKTARCFIMFTTLNALLGILWFLLCKGNFPLFLNQ